MSLLAVRLGVAAITVAASAAAYRAAARTPVRRATSAPTRSVDTAEAVALPPGALLPGLVARNPFRKERRPAQVRFGEPERVEAPAAPQPPRPALVLVGVLLGDEPAALIRDPAMPETPTRLVLPGEVVARHRLLLVTGDSVMLAGADSVLVLRLRRP